MGKRGQVTIFIIAAILLIAIVSIFFLIRGDVLDEAIDKVTQRTFGASSQSPTTKLIVEECFRESLGNGIYIVGSTGGYIIPPENYIDEGLFGVSYGIYEGKNVLPSLEDMQWEISSYIEISMSLCLDAANFSDDIKVGEIISETEISNDNVLSTLNVPIIITLEGDVINLEDEYNQRIVVGLGEVHNTAKNIIQNKMEDIEFIDLHYLSEQELQTDVLILDNGDLIYSIEGEPTEDFFSYIFNFGVRV